MTDPTLPAPRHPGAASGRIFDCDPPLEDETAPDGDVPAEVLEGRTSRSGVRWVRASDLLPLAAGHAVGRGIDLHVELARRLHTTARSATRHATAARASAAPAVASDDAAPMHARGRGTERGL